MIYRCVAALEENHNIYVHNMKDIMCKPGSD